MLRDSEIQARKFQGKKEVNKKMWIPKIGKFLKLTQFQKRGKSLKI